MIPTWTTLQRRANSDMDMGVFRSGPSNNRAAGNIISYFSTAGSSPSQNSPQPGHASRGVATDAASLPTGPHRNHA